MKSVLALAALLLVIKTHFYECFFESCIRTTGYPFVAVRQVEAYHYQLSCLDCGSSGYHRFCGDMPRVIHMVQPLKRSGSEIVK